MAINIRPEIESISEEIIATRQDFHKYPELAFNEHRSAKIIAEKLISFGCEGAILAGTTGMSSYLSIQDKMNLIEEAGKSSQKEKMIIGPATTSLLDTASLINFAKSKGLNRFLCQPCAYGWPGIKNKDEAIYSYFSALLKRTGTCEIIFYNYPIFRRVVFGDCTGHL